MRRRSVARGQSICVVWDGGVELVGFFVFVFSFGRGSGEGGVLLGHFWCYSLYHGERICAGMRWGMATLFLSRGQFIIEPCEVFEQEKWIRI